MGAESDPSCSTFNGAGLEAVNSKIKVQDLVSINILFPNAQKAWQKEQLLFYRTTS